MRWWSLMLVACSGAMPGPAGPEGDGDGDGWAPVNGDCDDSDPDVHPLGIEVPLDGIDQDCDGVDAEALVVEALQPGDLRITEFMPDPLAVDAALGEWVEVRNTTDLPIDLSGLLLRDDLGDEALLAGSFLVPPGGYVVLGGSTDPLANGGAPIDVAWQADMRLSNTADAFVLVAGIEVIDRVTWDSAWPVEDGRSVALDPDVDADDASLASSWCAGTSLYGPAGYGSPGEANAPCPLPFEGLTVAELSPGDLVITEVMQSPGAVEDDLGEWLEIYNAAGDVVELEGLTVWTSEGDESTIDTSVQVGPGQYVLLAAFDDPAINGGLRPDWAWNYDLGLRGSGMGLELRWGTTVLDAIVYDNGLTFPDPTGASMQLDAGSIDAALNDDGARWCEGQAVYGAGDLGTPGGANEAC